MIIREEALVIQVTLSAVTEEEMVADLGKVLRAVLEEDLIVLQVLLELKAILSQEAKTPRDLDMEEIVQAIILSDPDQAELQIILLALIAVEILEIHFQVRVIIDLLGVPIIRFQKIKLRFDQTRLGIQTLFQKEDHRRLLFKVTLQTEIRSVVVHQVRMLSNHHLLHLELQVLQILLDQNQQTLLVELQILILHQQLTLSTKRL